MLQSPTLLALALKIVGSLNVRLLELFGKDISSVHLKV